MSFVIVAEIAGGLLLFAAAVGVIMVFRPNGGSRDQLIVDAPAVATTLSLIVTCMISVSVALIAMGIAQAF